MSTIKEELDRAIASALRFVALGTDQEAAGMATWWMGVGLVGTQLQEALRKLLPAPLTLYLVVADDNHGNNVGQFVWANSVEEATKMWKEHCAEIDIENVVPQVRPLPAVPPAKAGIVPWTDIPQY